MRKPILRVSNNVGHQLGCTNTEDGEKLSDLRRIGVVLFMK